MRKFKGEGPLLLPVRSGEEERVANVVMERLRHGAEVVASPFEPRSKLIYQLLAVELLATAILFPATGFSISIRAAAAFPLWAFFLCFAALLLRRYGHSRTSDAMEATGLVYGQGFLLLFLLFPLTAMSAPFADDALAGIDRFLGFDWPSFASLFVGRRFAQWALVVVYHSFIWQPLVIVLSLFASGRDDRAWQFVTAGTLAALITGLLFPFAPALGAFVHYGVEPGAFPKLQSGWQFAPVLHAIKDEGVRLITPQMFSGVVSFPSYHAAAALIFAWAMWPFRARWLFVVLNIGVCASALIVGAHYFIDILAGLAVGGAAIFVSCPRSDQQLCS